MSIFKLPLITALFFGLIISCGKPESDPDKGKTNPQPQVVGVTSVSIDKTSLSLAEGESATLSATVKPDNATNKTVSWSSSNSSVATVDAAGKVSLGCTVKVRDIELDEISIYAIVGSQEADPADFRISDDSPFGRAMAGKSVGDIVEVDAPVGVLKFEILSVEK